MEDDGDSRAMQVETVPEDLAEAVQRRCRCSAEGRKIRRLADSEHRCSATVAELMIEHMFQNLCVSFA
jgi:hypothetical protein